MMELCEIWEKDQRGRRGAREQPTHLSPNTAPNIPNSFGLSSSSVTCPMI